MYSNSQGASIDDTQVVTGGVYARLTTTSANLG